MFSAVPFEPMESETNEERQEGQRRLCRFPAQEDESDYFANEGEESEPYDPDANMTEAGGRHA